MPGHTMRGWPRGLEAKTLGPDAGHPAVTRLLFPLEGQKGLGPLPRLSHTWTAALSPAAQGFSSVTSSPPHTCSSWSSACRALSVQPKEIHLASQAPKSWSLTSQPSGRPFFTTPLSTMDNLALGCLSGFLPAFPTCFALSALWARGLHQVLWAYLPVCMSL